MARGAYDYAVDYLGGLIGGFQRPTVADIYSAADTVKKRVKSLIGNPREFAGNLNEDAKTALDQDAARTYLSLRAFDPKQANKVFPQFSNADPVWVASQAAKADARTQDVVMGLIGGGKAPARSKVRVGTNGQYVGAPPGVDSPQKFGALVADYQKAMMEGFQGRNFYNDSSAEIWARTGHNVTEADRLAQNLSALSRSNQVGGNTTMSVNGAIQAATGSPIRTGKFPSVDSKVIEQIYSPEEVASMGFKRDPFVQQLSVAWNPGAVGRGVNDIHEARLMGYPTGKVGGETQHAFMDDVRSRAINLANEKQLGGISDWTTGTAQAGTWTGSKIRQGKLKPEDAAKSYADYFPLHEWNATYEGVSSPLVPHMRGLLDAPWEVQYAYTHHPSGSWDTSAAGRDILHTETGFLPGPTVKDVAGRFEGGSKPGLIGRPLGETKRDVIGTKIDPKTGKTVNISGEPYAAQSTKDSLTAIEAYRAFNDGQAAGAGHKIFPSSEPNYTGARVDFGRALTGEEMKKLAPAFEARGYDIATDPNGLTVMSLSDKAAKGGDMSKEIRSILKGNSEFKGAKAVFGRLETVYADFAKEWGQGNGAATAKLFSYLDQAPRTSSLLNASIPARDAAVARTMRDLEFSQMGYGTPYDKLLYARQLIAEGGLDKLREVLRVNPSSLPAAFALPGGLLGYEESQTGR